SVKQELGIPVKFIGVGEGIDDMEPFNASEFAKALFDNNDALIEKNEDSGAESDEEY
ncbi:MAG: signal recognition particle-docking protein FtsY, partial [Clostridia bacterium]|nr:signal recognition particle-docking protein FtsY [Clostridia bacterium]